MLDTDPKFCQLQASHSQWNCCWGREFSDFDMIYRSEFIQNWNLRLNIYFFVNNIYINDIYSVTSF